MKNIDYPTIFERRSFRNPQVKMPLGDRFPKNSFPIGYRPTNQVSSKMDLKFVILRSKYPLGTVFPKTRFLLVIDQPIRFRAKWTSNS
jgi:hypothetical protein